MTTFHTDKDYEEEEGDPRERLRKICDPCKKDYHHLCNTIRCDCTDTSHKIQAVEDVALD